MMISGFDYQSTFANRCSACLPMSYHSPRREKASMPKYYEEVVSLFGRWQAGVRHSAQTVNAGYGTNSPQAKANALAL
jgi:hypothetical protein